MSSPEEPLWLCFVLLAVEKAFMLWVLRDLRDLMETARPSRRTLRTGHSHWADLLGVQQKAPQAACRAWQPPGAPVLPAEGLSVTEEKPPSNSKQQMDIKNP